MHINWCELSGVVVFIVFLNVELWFLKKDFLCWLIDKKACQALLIESKCDFIPILI